MTTKSNFLNLRMDQATDDPAPGAPAPQATPAPAAAAEEKFDSHGYPIVEPKPEPAPAPAPEESTFPKPAEGTPAKPDETPIAPSSGYDKPPEPAPKPEEKPAEIPKPEDKPKEGELRVEDKGNLSEAEVAKVLKFAKDHNLPQSVVDADIAERKLEQEQYDKDNAKTKQDAQNAAKAQQSSWYEELKADPEFGGEQFENNVKKVDKLVADFMPNFKKELTKAGAMLPPYIMRDFFKLANHLHKTGTLVEGDPAAEKAKEEQKKGEKNAHLDFYQDS